MVPLCCNISTSSVMFVCVVLFCLILFLSYVECTDNTLFTDLSVLSLQARACCSFEWVWLLCALLSGLVNTLVIACIGCIWEVCAVTNRLLEKKTPKLVFSLWYCVVMQGVPCLPFAGEVCWCSWPPGSAAGKHKQKLSQENSWYFNLFERTGLCAEDYVSVSLSQSVVFVYLRMFLVVFWTANDQELCVRVLHSSSVV